MPIPFDINNPVVPVEVLHSKLAYDIVERCQTWRTPIPADLQKFVKEQDIEAWGDWEQTLLKAADTASEELLNKWVEAVRGHHFCRANLRALAMQKFHPEEYAKRMGTIQQRRL